MNSRITVATTGGGLTAWLFYIVLLFAGASSAAEDASLLKDLTSTLALLNMPCGQVVSARRVGEKADDQLVLCKDGNRYRVFVDANDRVVARKQ